jgi:hypothetical protein
LLSYLEMHLRCICVASAVYLSIKNLCNKSNKIGRESQFIRNNSG